MAAVLTPAEEILEQFKEKRLKARSDREATEQVNRQALRDSVVQLREPSPRPASGPAVASQPTFKIGDAKGFPHVVEHGDTSTGNGHLSKAAATEFYDHLKDAAKRPDAAGRDASVAKAAKAVAHDWAQKHGLIRHGKESLVSTAIHEARAQAAFASREIGSKLGLNPVESTVIGYSLERALEKEGFKVFANHAIDKASDVFKASASSVANASGLRHGAEQSLSKSLNWLSSHGVTKEALKDAVGKHAGKLAIVAEASNHPEVVQRVAYTLAKSDKLMDGAMLLAKDDEFRKAVGTLAVSAGETLVNFNKGAGSVAIVAGSALRGDSSEETARHAFRAALTVLGGAAGGLAGGGVASLATGTAGAMAGSWVADKLLDVYDKHLGGGKPHQAETMVAKQEVRDSTRVVADRVATRMKDETTHAAGGRLSPELMAKAGHGMEREYSMGKKPPSSTPQQS